MTKAVKDETTITAIMLLPSPLCCLLDTSTPIGFIAIPLLSWPLWGPLSMVDTLKGAGGGEGGRPVQVQNFQKSKDESKKRVKWFNFYGFLPG